MAPAAAASPARRKPRENQYLFDLGVRGRKTGLTLPDTGIRDEHGLEPMDHLFSSPDKPSPKSNKSTRKVNGTRKNPNSTISNEEDMEGLDSTAPEVAEVLTERKRASMRLPPPRSRSPIKTFLQSPARRHPSLGPISSPTRGSVITPKEVRTAASVRRKLDFSTESYSADVTNGLPSKQFRMNSSKSMNGTRLVPPKRTFPSDDDDGIVQVEDDAFVGDGADSYLDGVVDSVLDVVSDEPNEEDNEVEESNPLTSQKTKQGNPREHGSKAIAAQKRGAGRPRQSVGHLVEREQERPTKKARLSLGRSKPPKDKKIGKTAAATGRQAPSSKSTTRKPKLAPISEADSPEIVRGPPMPRNNRGLFILRRETPMEGTFKQTRSGRNSIKPVAWWKNERIEYEEDEAQDGETKFLLSRIKEVVRAEEVEPPKRLKNKTKRTKGRKQTAEPDSEADEEVEAWEEEPGRIYGDVRLWDPEDQIGSQTQEAEEEIALSSAAIITRDIPGGTFKFAKTLTLPFFGSGMVDLPPGAVKKPKNSRKMQMAFFVYYGRVQVTVNKSSFGIGKGGMWQVPRGNFYSIENDYDKPARIFFSQGCEVEVEEEPIES